MNTTTNNDQVKNLIQIRKSLSRGNAGKLAENKAFLDFLQIQKELTEQIDATWDAVKEAMLANDIKKIDGDWGYITMADRQNISGTAAPRFMKKVLDTSKIKAYMQLHRGKLPEGVKLSTTKYLAKQIRIGA